LVRERTRTEVEAESAEPRHANRRSRHNSSDRDAATSDVEESAYEVMVEDGVGRSSSDADRSKIDEFDTVAAAQSQKRSFQPMVLVVFYVECHQCLWVWLHTTIQMAIADAGLAFVVERAPLSPGQWYQSCHK
jgi:hypothetical protein